MKVALARYLRALYIVLPGLGVLVLISPAIAEAADSEVMLDGSGVPVAVCASDQDHGVVVTALRQIGSLRRNIAKLRKERDIVAALSDLKVRDEVASKIEAWTGIPQKSPEIAHEMEKALQKKELGDAETLALKRLFVYDEEDVLERLRQGEQINYLAYDAKSDSVNLAWSSDKARELGDTVDMPIILIIKSSGLKNADASVRSYLGLYASSAEYEIKLGYRARGYAIISETVSGVLRPRLAGTSRWFVNGVSSLVTIYILQDLIGQKDALDAFNEGFPRQALGRTVSLADLESWDLKSSNPEQIVYTRAAVTVISNVVGKVHQPGLVKILQLVEQKSQAGFVSSDDIFAAFVSSTNIDVRPQLAAELAFVK